MLKVLFIGGTGCISQSISELAVNKNIDLTLINRGNRKIPQGATLIKADVRDLGKIENELKGKHYDVICDFLVYTESQLKDSFIFFKNYCDQYIFISSCAVTDSRVGGILDEESNCVLPIWQYSVDKMKCEETLKKMASKSNVSYTIVRPCVTFDSTRIPYGISPRYGYHWTLCARILANKPIIRWNKGINKCNMMRSEDFAEAFIGLLGNIKAFNETIIIAGEEAPSFNDVLSEISNYLNKEVSIIDVTSEFYAKELPYRSGEILGGRSIDAIFSIKKLKGIVPKFKQKYTFKEGIKKTIEDIKDQNYQYGIDYIFDAECDRIIEKWNKINHISSKHSLRFVDYLNKHSFSDKITYYIYRYKINLFLYKYFILFIKCFSVKRVTRKILHILR